MPPFHAWPTSVSRLRMQYARHSDRELLRLEAARVAGSRIALIAGNKLVNMPYSFGGRGPRRDWLHPPQMFAA